MTEFDRNAAYEVRSYPRLIERLGADGSFNAALSDALAEIVAALQNAAIEGNGKAKAGLSVKVEFTLDNGMVRIAGRHAVTLPKQKEHASHLFVTPDNILTLMNPRQRELPLVTVPAHRDEPMRV